jgi:ATP-dependent RNA helicase RhlE
LVHPVDRARKRALLAFLIGSNNWQQVLVFARTKHGADRLCQQLIKDGLSSIAIHGNKSQGARTRALDDFKKGKVRVLVATDIAARGLDIDQLPHVVNHDLPNVPEDYIHRIGRTARAGLQGHAVSLVCSEESEQLTAIERLLNVAIPQEAVAGFEPRSRLRSAHSKTPRRQNPSTKGRASGRRKANSQNARGSSSRRWQSRRAA